MNAQLVVPFDLAGVYTLVRGVPVVARSPSVVQIGHEPPRGFLLHRAPPNSVMILKRLDGTLSAADVLQRHQADPAQWAELLGRLLDAQLLVPAGDWSFPGMGTGALLEPERDSLVHRHGIAAARRVMQARQDAIVVVRGSGRLATSVAVSLAVAGVGHVHQQPDRALRIADLPEFAAPRPSPAQPEGRARREGRRAAVGFVPAVDVGAPTRGDVVRLAANLRRAAPNVKVHAPAAHHRVGLVVLVGDGPPSPSLAAELTDRRIPHLAVTAGLSRAVVGPFVLPGRSSCLVCALHSRAELDDTRPAFEQGLRNEIVVPPVQLVCSAAAVAVAEALDHLDGISAPATVDGTLEWQLGNLSPRRRSWTAHPNCGCSELLSGTAHDSPADAGPMR